MSERLRARTGIGVLALPVVAAALAVSCQMVKTAPQGLPRVEVEVVFATEDGFQAPLAAGVDREELRQLVRDTVEPIADIGLRFYPVASERYLPGQPHPEYVMTITAKRLVADRDLKLTHSKIEGEPASIQASLRGIACTLDARLEKRRASGPPLLVCSAQAVGHASSPSLDDPSVEAFELKKHENESNVTAVRRDVLASAVDDAAKHAFAELQTALDRDLALQATPTSSATAAAPAKPGH